MIDCSRPEAFRTSYPLLKSGPNRIEFTVPRLRISIFGMLALPGGLVILLNRESFADQPEFMISVAGWGAMLLAVSMFYLALSRRGSLVIDGELQRVILDFRSPGEHTTWSRPFT